LHKKTPKEFGNSWELIMFLHHDVGDKKDYLLCLHGCGIRGVMDDMTYPDKPGNKVLTLFW
jgi:hypothetical protein